MFRSAELCDVCNLPKVREPFHQLCCVIFVELDVREVHLEHRRAGVADPEEHQLSLAQVHRRQCRRVQRSQGFTMVAIWYIYMYMFYDFCISVSTASVVLVANFSCWCRARGRGN